MLCLWMVFDHRIWQPRHFIAMLQLGSGLSQMFVMVYYDHILDWNPGPLVHSSFISVPRWFSVCELTVHCCCLDLLIQGSTRSTLNLSFHII